MAIIFYIIFGLLVGSFLTVCIYRIPAGRDDLDEFPFGEGEKEDKPEEKCEESAGEKGAPAPDCGDREKLGINTPSRSICPVCRTQLLWYHNIPVLSWIFLRGRCGFCGEKISFRYPFVELLTAGASLASFHVYGLNPTGFVVFAFVCALLVISFIDYDYYIIPNVISLPGFVIAFCLAVLNQFTNIFSFPVVPGVVPSLWGILCGGGFLWGFAELYYLLRKKEGLGMGDVKLLAMIGALLGPQGSIYTIFLGSVFGSFLGIGLMLLGGRKWSKPLPFGPYLALGSVLYIFVGDKIISWWVGGATGMLH